jgi:hypothetical protein
MHQFDNPVLSLVFFNLGMSNLVFLKGPSIEKRNVLNLCIFVIAHTQQLFHFLNYILIEQQRAWMAFDKLYILM